MQTYIQKELGSKIRSELRASFTNILLNERSVILKQLSHILRLLENIGNGLNFVTFAQGLRAHTTTFCKVNSSVPRKII